MLARTSGSCSRPATAEVHEQAAPEILDDGHAAARARPRPRPRGSDARRSPSAGSCPGERAGSRRRRPGSALERRRRSRARASCSSCRPPRGGRRTGRAPRGCGSRRRFPPAHRARRGRHGLAPRPSAPEARPRRCCSPRRQPPPRRDRPARARQMHRVPRAVPWPGRPRATRSPARPRPAPRTASSASGARPRLVCRTTPVALTTRRVRCARPRAGHRRGARGDGVGRRRLAALADRGARLGDRVADELRHRGPRRARASPRRAPPGRRPGRPWAAHAALRPRSPPDSRVPLATRQSERVEVLEHQRPPVCARAPCAP